MSPRTPRSAANSDRQRLLPWDGCFNARDLGGLPTDDGRTTRWRAVARADALDGLTAQGWSAVEKHGIRTIVDLRNDDEIGSGLERRPAGLTTVRVPLDDVDDADFWQHCRSNDLDGSPLYYRSFLERKPERCTAALVAVARAQPGGVVLHCNAGRDRTGLISVLLLALVRVTPDEIVADYELSAARLPPFFAARGEPDQALLIDEILTRANTSPRTLILDLLGSLDVGAYLSSAGLEDEDLRALCTRLLGSRPE